MKRLFIILTLFLIFINTSALGKSAFVKKEVKTVTPDNFTLISTLQYPNIKQQKEFKTVVLLHSMGYDSNWWEDLPTELLNRGYAVLLIDFRGHGKSVYNSKLVRVSWKNMTNAAFAKYPSDVLNIIEQVKKDNPKKVFFNDWAIIGSDVGAATGIIAANKMEIKPKTIVMLSPVVKTRSIYAPVSLAEMNNVDILSVCGINDISSVRAQNYLRKFAQSNYAEYSSTSKASGMLMIKNDSGLTPLLASWIAQYLK